jgi:hypothetical protein
MNSLKLYGTGSATANAVANVLIPTRGKLKGIAVALWADSVTDNAQVNCEVSKASAREIAVNGAQQCVVEVGLAGNFLTSGLAQFGVNQFFPLDIDVTQGQLIYLHAVVTGTLTYNFTGVIIYG